MDISMPRMNGIDATRILRRDAPNARVIIVSQDDPAIVRLRTHEVDAAGYVPKSKLAEELLPTIDRVVATMAAKNKGQSKLAAALLPRKRFPISIPRGLLAAA